LNLQNYIGKREGERAGGTNMPDIIGSTYISYQMYSSLNPQNCKGEGKGENGIEKGGVRWRKRQGNSR
jgi:hypothetical protein